MPSFGLFENRSPIRCLQRRDPDGECLPVSGLHHYFYVFHFFSLHWIFDQCRQETARNKLGIWRGNAVEIYSGLGLKV